MIYRFSHTAVYVGLTLGLLVLFSLLTAAPIQGQTENLLLNGDFEEGFSAWNGQSSIEVATGWTPFWVTEGLDIPDNSTGARPEFMASDSSVPLLVGRFPGSRANYGILSSQPHSRASINVCQSLPMQPYAYPRGHMLGLQRGVMLPSRRMAHGHGSEWASIQQEAPVQTAQM